MKKLIEMLEKTALTTAQAEAIVASQKATAQAVVKAALKAYAKASDAVTAKGAKASKASTTSKASNAKGAKASNAKGAKDAKASDADAFLKRPVIGQVISSGKTSLTTVKGVAYNASGLNMTPEEVVEAFKEGKTVQSPWKTFTLKPEGDKK